MDDKEINRLAIPAIIAGIAEPLIGIADSAIIGNLGTSELAGVGIASSFFSLLVWVLSQMKSSISALVSKEFGAGREAGYGGFVSQSLWLTFLSGVVFAVCIFYFSEHLLQIYNAKNEVLAHGTLYLNIRIWGLPLSLIIFAMFGVFRGLQNTYWAMWIAICGSIVNVILDFVLVYGLFSFEGLGVEGAAWASILSQIVMLVLTIRVLFRNTPFHLKLKMQLHPDMGVFLNMSLNLFIRTIALNVVYFLATRFAAGISAEAAAAHTICLNIWIFSAFFLDGYANAGNAIAGKLLGQGNSEAIYSLGKKLMVKVLWVSAGLSFSYLLLYPFVGEFFTDDENVTILINSCLWLVILSQPLNAIAFVFDGIFKGLGQMKLLRNVLLFTSLVFFAPYLVLMETYYPVLFAVWIGFVLWICGRGGTLFYLFNKQFKPKS